MSRRFLACRSSSGIVGLASLSICRLEMSEAFAAAFGFVCFTGRDPANPSSTRRRMACEREAALLRTAHPSIAFVSSVDKRIAETGSCPVAGRPLFFRFMDLADFMTYSYYENASLARPRGAACNRPRPERRVRKHGKRL